MGTLDPRRHVFHAPWEHVHASICTPRNWQYMIFFENLNSLAAVPSLLTNAVASLLLSSTVQLASQGALQRLIGAHVWGYLHALVYQLCTINSQRWNSGISHARKALAYQFPIMGTLELIHYNVSGLLQANKSGRVSWGSDSHSYLIAIVSKALAWAPDSDIIRKHLWVISTKEMSLAIKNFLGKRTM